jgi:hypothetical protein
MTPYKMPIYLMLRHQKAYEKSFKPHPIIKNSIDEMPIEKYFIRHNGILPNAYKKNP